MVSGFTWGDEVLVAADSGEERIAWVCSPPSEGDDGMTLVEYEDGSDEQVPTSRIRPRL